MNTKLTDFFIDKTENEIKIINSDVYAGLDYLEDNTIDCAVTSPPYWGQRDYGFEGQIGNEKELSEYIEKLELIYRKLRDKLDNKGIFFLNIGDKYFSRYGNSKLGMIPYKLAKFMVENDWILEDIIIWHKPNHMPGSYKNRFTSTYEPIFVFAKSKENYYREYVQNNKNTYSSVLNVHLQPTSYNHVAAYPEKLIENLLKYGFPTNSTVLDPFGGSGTTGKAVQNLNKKYNYLMDCVLIEANKDYVNIIKERCNISPKQEVIVLPFKDYKTKIYRDNNLDIHFNPVYNDVQKYSKKYLIKIFENYSDLLNFVNEMKFGNVYDALNNKGVIFLGIKNNTIENIQLISTLNEFNWVIRNQIIIKNDNSWYPIYLIVKDTKKSKYILNMDAVRIEHKDNTEENWNSVDFIGYKVINSLLKNKEEGMIVKILDTFVDGMPSKVVVKWENDEFTEEIVKHNGYLDESMSFSCPKCNSKLLNYYDDEIETKCTTCNLMLWSSLETIPILNITNEIYPKIYAEFDSQINVKDTRKDYNGKFKDMKTINMGASPGARSSTQETYYSVQRIYDFPQEMIADILKILLKHSKLSKKELTNLFPKSYLHTVGHWFRKDMGGSLPAPEDLNTLTDILDIPSEFVNLMNARCLVLQAVKKSHKGKNPGDYLEFKNETDVYDFLRSAVELN